MPATPHDSEPTAHVFDQTNGVLGAEEESEQEQDAGSPKFGVPPIVSL